MEALPYTEMTPSRPEPNVLIYSKPASVYLVYALAAGPIKLQLPEGHDYTVESIDTWNMKTTQIADAKPGDLALTAPAADSLFRVTAK